MVPVMRSQAPLIDHRSVHQNSTIMCQRGGKLTCLITNPPKLCPNIINFLFLPPSSLLTATKHPKKSRACSTIPAVEFANAAVASYPNVIIRAVGRSEGRKSRSQRVLVMGSVHVRVWLPLRPCRAMMLFFV